MLTACQHGRKSGEAWVPHCELGMTADRPATWRRLRKRKRAGLDTHARSVAAVTGDA